MPLAQYDSEYARGKRRRSPIPGKGAQLNVEDIDQAGLLLENKFRAILLDSDEKKLVGLILDMLLVYAAELVRRYDRNGPPVNESLLQRLEGTLRLATEFPDQFKDGFVKDLKSNIASLQKKVG